VISDEVPPTNPRVVGSIPTGPTKVYIGPTGAKHWVFD
jgi:hypothetical protein